MPELPEVETIKKQFAKQLIGKTFKTAQVLNAKTINLPIQQFEKIIKGKKIIVAQRFSKMLVIKLSGDWNLLFHLKLTGQLVFNQINKYVRVIFFFTDGTSLNFNDVRKFGYIKLLNNQELERFLAKADLGVEPLDKKFTLALFKQMLSKKSKAKIKILLMDQHFITGIGNIYAQEACFEAKIHPERKAGTLKDHEIKVLFQAMKKILKFSIKQRGLTAENYLDLYGKQGNFQNFLYVYQRKGKKCMRCEGKIERIDLGGRGTYFCAKCQK